VPGAEGAVVRQDGAGLVPRWVFSIVGAQGSGGCHDDRLTGQRVDAYFGQLRLRETRER